MTVKDMNGFFMFNGLFSLYKFMESQIGSDTKAVGYKVMRDECTNKLIIGCSKQHDMGPISEITHTIQSYFGNGCKPYYCNNKEMTQIACDIEPSVYFEAELYGFISEKTGLR
jgi:hypothetical protein